MNMATLPDDVVLAAMLHLIAARIHATTCPKQRDTLARLAGNVRKLQA